MAFYERRTVVKGTRDTPAGNKRRLGNSTVAAWGGGGAGVSFMHRVGRIWLKILVLMIRASCYIQ